MADIVQLKPVDLIENQELIADLCRFRENLLTEKFIRRKYRLDNATWERLGSDEGDALVEKIEAESLRRVRDGSAKREKSQALIVKGPAILDSIASDVSASPRHRVDALKVLDDFAATGPAAAAAQDRFVITINLNGDVEHFDKSISISADDTPPVAITAAKPKDDEQW